MKLAFISYWSCHLERLGVLNAGGMNVYVYNLAISLGKLGHRIDIFTKTHNTKEQKILQLNQNICLIHLPVTYKDPYLDVNPYANNLTQYIRSNNLHYDVLHSHYFYSARNGMRSMYMKNCNALLALRSPKEKKSWGNMDNYNRNG